MATVVKAKARLRTPTGFAPEAVAEVSKALNGALADAYALYFKAKNFHWHVSGPHFRDYHLLLDEQAAEVLEATDEIAERVRKIGGVTLRSLNEAARMARIKPNEAEYVAPDDMLAELIEDNRAVAEALRAAHEVCDGHGDVASASMIEVWIDAAERRVWFLFETLRPAVGGGH